MIRVALRGLAGRKLRAVLTAFAIILGVAMISGTYVLTDTISKAFDSIFADTYKGTSAVVTSKSVFDTSEEGVGAGPTLPASLLTEVKRLPDVEAAVGGVEADTQLIKANGKAIVHGGAPNIGTSVTPSQPRFESLTLVGGSWPSRDKQVAIDEATAKDAGYSVGDRIGVQAAGPVERFRISGLVRLGSVASIGGATIAAFELRTAQRLFHKEGRLDDIKAAARTGVSPEQLVGQIKPILPPAAQVRTGEAQASSDAKDTQQGIGFVQKFLLAFAGIALFVGSFVIANTLSITIAQRMRELATMRTIGASRRQVLASVMLEALVIGTMASLLGLFLGLALAKGLDALFVGFGIDLPKSGLVFSTRTIVVSLGVGILVTLLASLRPALRATRVPPIAAVREGATLPPGRYARFRPVAAIVLGALGVGSLCVGLFVNGLGTRNVLLLMGLGAVLIFFGVALFAATLVRPLAAVLGYPAARLAGVAGVLARDNAKRNPARTAATASALMIGLALVTLVAVLAQGIRQSFTGAVDKIFVADYAITADNNFSPIPTSSEKAAAKITGVTLAAGVRTDKARVFKKVQDITAVDPNIAPAIKLDWKDGSQAVFRNLGRGGAFVDDGYAKDHHLTVGSPLRLETPSGDVLHLRIKGIFDPPSGGSPFGPVTFSAATFDAHYAQPKNLFAFINVAGGVTDANTAKLKAALNDFPNIKLQTRSEFKDNQIGGLNSILNILYALLALSIIVSLFGIVNTLVLTVFERTRELGMLRAIGMTRRQVRRMIRQESIVTALIGAALGIAVGIGLASLLVVRLDFIVFSLPVESLVVFAIAAVIVGILAAIFPARRASRLRILQALQYE